MSELTQIHPDFMIIQAQAYLPNQLICRNWLTQVESKEYAAASFDLNQWRVQFRVAKITPKKIGQFVTLWQRIGKGPIRPYGLEDVVDFFVINVRDGERLGQFIFPKSVLGEQGILSRNGKGGKLAFRLYPSWNVVDSNQAKKTQAWQLRYFFEINSSTIIASATIKQFFCE